MPKLGNAFKYYRTSLYYSYAITTNSCINPFPPVSITTCVDNNYTYILYKCTYTPGGEPEVNCPEIVTNHSVGTVCDDNQTFDLGLCTDPLTLVQTRYMCAIVSGQTVPPTEDAYIEWHWISNYGDNGQFIINPISPPPFPPLPLTTADTNALRFYTTGKFIFVASAAYIASQFTQYGYGGISGNGIGMFNPSNHNS